jgi:hypothetical protein
MANPSDPDGEQDKDQRESAAVPGEHRIRITSDRPSYTAAGASLRLIAYQLMALPAHAMSHAAEFQLRKCSRLGVPLRRTGPKGDTSWPGSAPCPAERMADFVRGIDRALELLPPGWGRRSAGKAGLDIIE